MWIILLLILGAIIFLISRFRIVPQAQVFVIERLGAFHAAWGTGFHVLVPFLDRIAKKVSIKEQVVDFKPQPVITKDNVTMQIDTVVFFKIFASAATNGGGGTGGIFAPSLFVGCLTGFVVAQLFNAVGMNVPKSNFAFAGMAGLMSGVMHAPFTGIFLIAELTGGYDLFMTLMITSTISYVTIKAFEPHSLYAIRLAQKGELLTHHKDKAVLTLLKIEEHHL